LLFLGNVLYAGYGSGSYMGSINAINILITILQAQDVILGSSITINQNNITILGSSITIDQMNINLMRSSITINQNNIAILGTSCTINQNNISLLSSSITINQNNISLLGSSVTIDQMNISLLASSSAINQNNISILASSITLDQQQIGLLNGSTIYLQSQVNTITANQTSTFNYVQGELYKISRSTNPPGSSGQVNITTGTQSNPTFASPVTVQSTMTVYKIVASTMGDTNSKIYGNISDCTGGATGGGLTGQVSYSTGMCGVFYSTFTISGWMQSDGDVFIATASLVAIMGCFNIVDGDTLTITSMRFYCGISTVGSTFFNVAYSSYYPTTLTGWGYVNSSAVEIATNTVYSSWFTPTVNVFGCYPTWFGLHCTAIPLSGTLPTTYGVEVKYWRRIN
jgi:hypothetical protein